MLDQVRCERQVGVVLVLPIVVPDEYQCPCFRARGTGLLDTLDNVVHHRTKPVPALLELPL